MKINKLFSRGPARHLSIFPAMSFVLTLFFLQTIIVQAEEGLLPRAGSIVSRSTSFNLPVVSPDNSEQTARSDRFDSDYSPATGLFSVGTDHVSWTVPGTATTLNAKVFYPRGAVGCPVIIFSHGLGASSERYGYLGKMWATHGIASIHPEHPGSNEAIWRGKIRAKEILTTAYQRYWNGRDRALAMKFAIDQLFATQGKLLTVPDAPQFDVSQIAVGGNDLGALAAMLLAGQLPPDNGASLKDHRVKAVLALSPPVFCDSTHAPIVYSGIDIPFMSVAGTHDDGVIGKTKAPERRIPFDHLGNIDHFHLTLVGADHQVYSGIRLRNSSQGNNDGAYQRTIMDVSMAFLAMTLRNDPFAATFLMPGGISKRILAHGFIESVPASVYHSERSVPSGYHPVERIVPSVPQTVDSSSTKQYSSSPTIRGAVGSNSSPKGFRAK